MSVANHTYKIFGDILQQRINALAIGQKMQDLPERLWHKSFKKYYHDKNRCGGPNLRLIRLNPDEPSLTVTGYIYNIFIHTRIDISQ